METKTPDLAQIEKATMRKVILRLVPFLMICYFFALLDRVNVGFAGIQMRTDLGLTASDFGWGAGIFFFGYFLLEVPSNLALERFGARIWIARIMVTWGLLSCAMAFVTGTWSFIVMRFLLGAAEAGFFPGVILYLTYWFPTQYRARIVGFFMIAIPISSFIGSPISGALLNVTGWGLKGWQWLFLLEGIPALLLAVATPFVLPNKPTDAKWLPAEEREWLQRTLADEAARTKPKTHPKLSEVLADPRVLLFAFIYFGSSASSYGLSIWTPQIIKEYGLTNFQTGLLNSVPYGLACIAMVLWGQHSDRTGERRWHLALSFLLLALGLAGGTVLTGLVPLIGALTVAACGVYMLKGPFWAMATEQMPVATAAASIAAINAVGNLGGFAGPFAIGWIKDATGSFTLSLLPMIVFGLVSAALALLVKRHVAREPVPAE